MSDQPVADALLTILLILSVLVLFAESVHSGDFDSLLGLGLMFLVWIGYKYADD